MASLSGAYRGYHHQDAVAAYLLATLLLPASKQRIVSAEQRVVPGDCFDDIELRGGGRRRIQIKSHQAGNRPLQLRDFTTEAISFRIDRMVQSYLGDPNPADEYRLFATYQPPEEALRPFLEPAGTVPALLSRVPTQRYRLALSQIWPEAGEARWPHLEAMDRTAFAAFCRRFVIEIGCPHSSTDLRQPGPLEQELLRVLADDVGIGLWPNNNRDLADAAAHLIYEAIVARTTSATLTEGDVVQALSLRVDYGRVPEVLPIEHRRLVERPDALGEIVASLRTIPQIAVTGSPGIGKSWLLYQLANRLRADGWWVAMHYCFIDLFDVDQSVRVTVETTFGSIMFELLNQDPSVAAEGVPRYAAGPRELEKLLVAGRNAHPDRKIAIIVDGLDHADRIPGYADARMAIEIADELAGLSLPEGVVLIVGSQPGVHLTSLLEGASEYRVSRWDEASIRRLVTNLDLENTLRQNNFENDEQDILDAIVEKADGSPLYATYLARTAMEIVSGDFTEAPDIAEYISAAPAFDDNLNAYYQWLINPIEAQTGGLFIIELLSLIDFSLTRDEIKGIVPNFAHHVDRVISSLSPVLVEDVSHGGLRVHHESFQRFVRDRLRATPDANLDSILRPAINWLDARGFFRDTRAFRSVFKLLEKSGRMEDLLSRVSDDFVDLAVRECQAGDAVTENLALVARIAAKRLNWPMLARLNELARAANTVYEWRFDDFSLAEAYGSAFGTLFGGGELASRLLHNGRSTFAPRAGLVLCRLCDNSGIVPPWIEYMAAFERQQATSNVHYGNESNAAISGALATGRIRLAGRDEGIRLCSEWCREGADPPASVYEIAQILGRMYGKDTVESVLEGMQAGPNRAWIQLALASLEETPEAARGRANRAVGDQLPITGWLAALRHGATLHLNPRNGQDIDTLTDTLLDSHVQFEPERFFRWFLEIRLWASAGDTVSLMRTEGRIPSDSWFHRWLRFCVTLVHPATKIDELLVALRDLSQNIEVFVGEPRVCDLYRLHDAIRMSFRQLLERLDEPRWEEALNYLAIISDETNTSLQRSRMGPLPVDALSELCLEAADTPRKRAAASAVCSKLLSADQRTNEYYDTHAVDLLILARIQAASGSQEAANASWREACTYLVAYGHHKDITIWELIDPLKTLATVDSRRARTCLQSLGSIIERVIAHTDGKETRSAIHSWIDLAGEIHPAGSLSYLAMDQIGDMPSFGDLDHSIPACLRALAGAIDPIALAASWVGIAVEARNDIEAALGACERGVAVSRSLGEQLWNVLVASLEGDCVRPSDNLGTLVNASAQIVGLAAPNIEAQPAISSARNEVDSSVGPGATHNVVVDKHSLPVGATPLQVVHAVRKWRDRGQPSETDSAVNAAGWRILEIVHESNRTSAEKILQRLARDTSPWEKSNILQDLAEGFGRHGETRLSAIANTYAYTRAGDGWRRFAGAKGEKWFRAALASDDGAAWATLADEIAESVAGGGPHGITVHLVMLLASLGRTDEAFKTWDAAFEQIAYRLPSVGAWDKVRIPYDHQVDNGEEPLWTMMITRMNSPTYQEKRVATLAVFIGIRFFAAALSVALRFAITHGVPISTLTVVLQLLDKYEEAPYQVTRGSAAELQSVAFMPFVSARVLARSLLERAGVIVAMPPPVEPGAALVSEDKAEEMVSGIGRARFSTAHEIWPEFARYFGTCFEAARASDKVKAEMERTVRRLGPRREGRRLALWTPIDEQIERCLQTTGAGVRAVLAQRGFLDPTVEDVVGRSFLGKVELGLRMSLSRTVRPTSLRLPSAFGAGTAMTGPTFLEQGQFANWVLFAHQEMELQLSDGYDHAVQGKLVCRAGLQFGEWRDSGQLPLGYPFPDIWETEEWKRLSMPERFGGPIASWDLKRDSFGRIEYLAPHPAILLVNDLTLAPVERGFAFVDRQGTPAVVCINWQRKLIGTDHLSDLEPIEYGVALLARTDIFDVISNLARMPAVYVTTVSSDSPDE